MKLRDFIYSYKSAGAFHNCLCIMGIRIKIRKPVTDRKFYHSLPIQENKIVFHSILKGYSCNPKYITEEIRRQNLPYDLVWIVDRHILKYIDSFPKDVRLVMGGTDDAVREWATAKIWVENERHDKLVRKGLFKREGQTYIQTWHGTFGLKTIGDKNKSARRSALELARMDAEQMDYFISNSKWETDFYKETFWNNGTIFEYGHARNDLLFREDKNEIKLQIYKKLGISPEKKLLLYAPTWRENKDIRCYTMDYTMVKDAFERRFGGEWVFAVKMHHLMFEHRNKFLPEGVEVLNISDYPDIQELHIAADAYITDYSSGILDFMLTRKPGFLYAADREKYENARGLYYPLEETPFPVAENNEKMVENIENFDEAAYKVRVEEFLKGKGCIEDGHAAARVVELIKSIMNKPKEETI